MSSPAADQDHSIEEILASIRQIISEDDQKSGADQMAAVAASPVAEASAPAVDLPLPADEPETSFDIPADPAPAADGPIDDDVFELVDRVDHEPETVDDPLPVADLGVTSPLPPAEPADMSFDLPPLPVHQPEPIPMSTAAVSSAIEGAVFTDMATSATLGAFSKLSETILMERKRAIEGASITLEDIVKELLQPLLREWIDRHVPGIVDRLVREELEKISRQVREG